MSTGAEEGRPGFAIYRQGGYLGAVVSTGEEKFQVEVFKLPPNNTWTNIAIKWEPFKFDDDAKFEEAKAKPDFDENEIGGLQLFYNLDMVSKAIVGIKCTGVLCQQDGLDPREMIVGCHATADDDTERNFANGRFDELAFWARRLNDTEMPYFLGGHSKDLLHGFH